MAKNILAGLGLGLLTGLIIGLSIGQVTGLILGALTSLLAGFFGLRPVPGGETGNREIIAAFGFSCMLAIFGGIYIRTHNLLAPSLKSRMNDYTAAGFSVEETKKIILTKEVGWIPEGHTFVADAKDKNGAGVLMSDKSELSICKDLDENASLDQILAAFYDSGPKCSRIAEVLEEKITDKDQLRELLLTIKKTICE